MERVTIKRTGAKPVEVSITDFDRAMGERIFRHWEETHSILNIDINKGEKQFAVVPRNQKDWNQAITPVENSDNETEN